jgi:hypothetical protein
MVSSRISFGLWLGLCTKNNLKEVAAEGRFLKLLIIV